MKIDRAGWPGRSARGPRARRWRLAAVGGPGWRGVLLGASALFMLYFFRDPERHRSRIAPTAPSCRRPTAGCSSPETPSPPSAPPGDWKQISIFLSPLDVHINRIPSAGRVTRVEHTPGRFLRPTGRSRPASTSATKSGSTATARRSCAARSSACSPGAWSAGSAPGASGAHRRAVRPDEVRLADRPVSCRRTATLRVAVGDRVRSGETVVATW